MKKRQLFLGLATIAAAVFSFSSCSQDELSTAKAETPDLGQEILLSTNFSTTRSVAQDIQTGTQILSGVQVGVFVATNGTTTSFVENGTNKAYTADGNGGLTAVDTENKVYYPKTGSVDIYAYAPYQSTWNATDVNADQDFTVQADQSSEANYLASDLIWATPQTGQTSSTDALALPFAHKLSKINITIDNQRSGLSLKGATVYILNTKPTATINLKTGELKKESDVVVASGDVTTITAATLTAGESEPTATASAVIAPQTLAAGAKFVKIVTSATYNTTEGSTTLYAKLGTGGKTFTSGNVYKYTVTIKENSVELSLGSTTLSGWTENTDNLDAEDADEPGIGDYVLNDGTFLKNSALSEADETTRGKIIAVIFSTDSQDNDYKGYAVSIAGTLTGKTWGASEVIGTSITSGTVEEMMTGVLDDYSGLSTTTTVQTKENYKSTYTAFDFSTLTDYTSTGKLSRWFMPSFAQMVDLIGGLGGVTNAKSTFKSNIVTAASTNDAQMLGNVDFVTAINNYKISNVSSDIISTGNYATTTESGSNIWLLKISSDLKLTRQAAKTGGSRNVLPIIAYKVPTE